MTTIALALQTVWQRLQQSCNAAGRDPSAVTLLAVSKTFGADAVAAAHAAGQRAFGENYVQEAVQKMQATRHLDGLLWHCIGPIQSNKARLVAEHFDWVHTVDSLRLAQRLSAYRPPQLPPLQVCVQVNIDGQATKSGVAPQAALSLCQAVSDLPQLRLRGLMAIPQPATDFVAACAVFTRVRELFDEIRAAGLPLDTLSMGMSADLEAAIACGSTLVRVGSAIFGARNYGPT